MSWTVSTLNNVFAHVETLSSTSLLRKKYTVVLCHPAWYAVDITFQDDYKSKSIGLTLKLVFYMENAFKIVESKFSWVSTVILWDIHNQQEKKTFHIFKIPKRWVQSTKMPSKELNRTSLGVSCIEYSNYILRLSIECFRTYLGNLWKHLCWIQIFKLFFRPNCKSLPKFSRKW